MSARPLQPNQSTERGDGRTANAAAGAQGAICVENLSVEFKRDGARTVAVQDVDIEIAPGEFTALLGPSGCGKSTLLNVIGGMVRPTRGEVRIDGAPVTEPSARCGVVFQQHSLFPWMTALGNVAFGPRMLGHAPPSRWRGSFSPSSAWRNSPAPIRRSSRAECSSASASRARWRHGRTCC